MRPFVYPAAVILLLISILSAALAVSCLAGVCFIVIKLKIKLKQIAG